MINLINKMNKINVYSVDCKLIQLPTYNVIVLTYNICLEKADHEFSFSF